MDFDAIIVGSGPAAVSAARALRGKPVLMLDLGLTGSRPKMDNRNLYDLRKTSGNLQDFLVGSRFEALSGILNPASSPKLRAEQLSFVTQVPTPDLAIDSDSFHAVQSFARGGLSNAWGAGVLRFNDEELRGFGVNARDLDPHFDDLTRAIGVNGERSDDLTPFLGSTEGLQPAIPLSKVSSWLYRRYQRASKEKLGFRMGRSRNTILTQDLAQRQAHRAYGQEFFQGNLPGIFHSGYTVDELSADPSFRYQSKAQVLTYAENECGVTVQWRNLETGAMEESRAKTLFLAAGAINSAKIVLQSHHDTETRLPILDNAVTFVPLFFPALFGTGLDMQSFPGGEMLIVVKDQLLEEDVYCSSYGLAAPLRTDLLAELPLDLASNLTLLREVIPNMLIVQVFYPDDPNPANYLQLQTNGRLHIRYDQQKRGSAERQVLAGFRKLGAWGFKALCKPRPPGSSIHYAGTLPVAAEGSQKYTCATDGRLHGTRGVYCVDGASFPRLPSKNLSFTIMARASKIAAEARDRL